MMDIFENNSRYRSLCGIGRFECYNICDKIKAAGTIFAQLKPWDERTDKSLQLSSLIATLQQKLSAIKKC